MLGGTLNMVASSITASVLFAKCVRRPTDMHAHHARVYICSPIQSPLANQHHPSYAGIGLTTAVFAGVHLMTWCTFQVRFYTDTHLQSIRAYAKRPLIDV